MYKHRKLFNIIFRFQIKKLYIERDIIFVIQLMTKLL